MTNKEAAFILSDNCCDYSCEELRTAFDLAIKALEAGMTKEELLKELKNCRNELCLRCGKYYEAHKGACDDCRYNFEHMKKWEAEE